MNSDNLNKNIALDYAPSHLSRSCLTVQSTNLLLVRDTRHLQVVDVAGTLEEKKNVSELVRPPTLQLFRHHGLLWLMVP